jgi:hypothetical protein
VKQQPVRERLAGDYRVHERDCCHMREVRQSRRLESHLDELTVERRIAHALAAEDQNSRRVQWGRRKEGLHRRHLIRGEGNGFVPEGSALPVDVSAGATSNATQNYLTSPRLANLYFFSAKL